MVSGRDTPEIANNPILKFLRKRIRVTPEVEGNAFFVYKPDPVTGKTVRWATPLFLALVMVFIGTKIFLVGIIGKIPPVFSLSVTFGLIAGGVLVSLYKTRGQPEPMAIESK